MDCKYPHWYHYDEKMEPCCDEYVDKDVCCDEPLPYKMYEFHRETLKDRILCLLGDEVILSVDARIWSLRSQYIKKQKANNLRTYKAVGLILYLPYEETSSSNKGSLLISTYSLGLVCHHSKRFSRYDTHKLLYASCNNLFQAE